MIKDMTTWDMQTLPPLPDLFSVFRQPFFYLAGPWHWTSGPEDSDWLDTTSREWQPVDIPNDLDALGLEPASGHMAFRRSVDIPADFKALSLPPELIRGFRVTGVDEQGNPFPIYETTENRKRLIQLPVNRLCRKILLEIHDQVPRNVLSFRIR